VNPFNRRSSVLAALATCGVAASVVLSGCSAGQVSQTATQEPAVNGTSGNIGNIALRNVHLRAEQTTDYVQPGTEVELLFVAANNSPDVADKLVSITSDIGEVTLTGGGDLPVNGSLLVGAPDGQISALQSVEPTDAAEARVDLSKPISNGLTYDFTFTFEKAGQTTVPVPISAGETPRREESGNSAGHGGGGGH
jgi:copper(I)-binding protein